MGKIRGQIPYEQWKSGEQITLKNAILANCYMCNGLEESNTGDCLGKKSCPLYFYSPWGRRRRSR